MSPGKLHLTALDGFRALSILAVLAAHMLPLGPKAWKLNSIAGLMGMSVFFCLSGFLITTFLLNRPDVKIFLIRRCARIVPLILLVTTLYCLVFQWRVDSFIAANLYVLNYTDSALVREISPLWSLSVEMHFYLAIALAFSVFNRNAMWLAALTAAIVTGLRAEAEIIANIRTHLRVDEILAGSLLAVLWWHRDSGHGAHVLRLLRGMFWPFFLLWLLSCSPLTWPLPLFRPYLTAAMVGAVLAMERGWQQALLGSRIFTYIATISYALYVWHSPFRLGWFADGSTAEIYLFRRPLGIGLVFLLAHLSTFYFERPITEYARRKTASSSKPSGCRSSLQGQREANKRG